MCDNYVTAALSGSGYAHVVVTIADLRSVIITHQSTGAWQMTRGSESPPSLMMFSQRSSSVILRSWWFLGEPPLSSWKPAGADLPVSVVMWWWLWCYESLVWVQHQPSPGPGVAHALNINTRRDHSFRNEFSVILLKVSKTRCILLDEEYEGLFFGTILIQYY